MTASLKLRQLETKISNLQAKKQELFQQRLLDIAGLISQIDLAHIDDKLLAGGFQFMREKITACDPIQEGWQQAGEKFLRKHKTKRNSSPKKTIQGNPTPKPPQSSPKSRGS